MPAGGTHPERWCSAGGCGSAARRSVTRERGCSSRLRSRLWPWPRRSGGSCGQRHGRSVQAKQAPMRRHLANRQSSCLEASSPNLSAGGAAVISAGVRCWLPLRLTSTATSCRSSLERGDTSNRHGSPAQYRTDPRRTSSTSARSSTCVEAMSPISGFHNITDYQAITCRQLSAKTRFTVSLMYTHGRPKGGGGRPTGRYIDRFP